MKSRVIDSFFLFFIIKTVAHRDGRTPLCLCFYFRGFPEPCKLSIFIVEIFLLINLLAVFHFFKALTDRLVTHLKMPGTI